MSRLFLIKKIQNNYRSYCSSFFSKFCFIVCSHLNAISCRLQSVVNASNCSVVFVSGFLLAMVSLSSCSVYFSPQRQLETLRDNNDSNKPLSQESTLDYETITTLSLSSCLKCHSGSKVPDLSTRENLIANMKSVLASVRDDRMPKGNNPKLNDCQKDALTAWADLGAPERTEQQISSVASCSEIGSGNATTTTSTTTTTTLPPPPLDQMPLDYKTVTDRILRPKCMSCHNPDSTSDAVDTLLFPYDEITAQRSLLGTSSANSKIFKKVTATDDTLMPPADSDYAHLTDEELTFLQRWLDAGHPEIVTP